jgi:hypothetical protein
MIGSGVRFGILSNYPARGDLAVACKRCKSEAIFTSPYDFLRDEAAEEAARDSRVSGAKWSNGFAVVRFPDVFPWRDSNNPYIHQKRGEVWGVLSCGACSLRQKHLLDWPADAFYRIDTPAGTLWAYTREHFLQIRRRIAREAVNDGPFDMNRLPKEFLQKRNQQRLLRDIDEFLMEGRDCRPTAK